MTHIVTIFLTLILFANTGQSNELDRLEIWGWDGKKQEFRDLYLAKTGTDLNKSYACAAELEKMRFKNALSIIYTDDVQAYLTGNINWSETDRLVIIREFPETEFSSLVKDTLLQNTIAQIIDESKINPGLLNEKTANKKFLNFELLLIGAINSVNTQIRDDSNLLLRELTIDKLAIGDNTPDLLEIMLSTPDPMTCYNAMEIIVNHIEEQQIIEKLDFRTSQTLKEFVFSDLQTFQPDAIEFLTSIFPARDNWTIDEWKEWYNEK